MANEIKIFCDESCHLLHDHADVMVLGALTCDSENIVRILKHLKWMKKDYLPELKWSRFNHIQLPLYKDLFDYFFEEPSLNFKATVVEHKNQLDHALYNDHSHMDFYYKMYYYTLRDFLYGDENYKIYLDYMSHDGGRKAKKLKEVLISYKRFEDSRINVTIIQSYESILIQLCDFFIGAIAYSNRHDLEIKSKHKIEFIEHMENKLNRSLKNSTFPGEKKFNIFKFTPRGVR
ncbi:DUF3800 domain-containing protein [Acinetobacter baumannii]|uniref:DUF3800 domain-containing protein n=1 Tax=Acinetobacter baumannii TaxID=470 RepID=UPI002340E16A|nr:DUF3800 domain-containing protein [Acinetobacter baumannii]MDC5074712.1 DUF3800 domain-containing protein [Acinetobacter baumannii]MDK2106645.1 DUF3800 domain-containing protein [Acinetobacter baumannii]MDK2111981.1 DUF3800 domain-containing protein [Acinetobacter baumannii]MDK2141525.1 DUF3800 domain-containing protein [Acinetobacter baumannii]MDK2152361.1 DUF3800 domain-containing protein [Acinetobacter baumannii]